MAGAFRKQATKCDACGAAVIGEPAGRGLYVRLRGDVVEHDQPPLCERCAHAIGMTALFRFAEEEEEG
jgi:hypothetical protein